MRLALVALSVVALALAACGGSGDGERIGELEAHLAELEAHLDGLEAHLAQLEARLAAVSADTERLETAQAERPIEETPIVVLKWIEAPQETAARGVYADAHCVRFRVAGTTQEDCRDAFFVINPADLDSASERWSQAVRECWVPMEVGLALPPCWRR